MSFIAFSVSTAKTEVYRRVSGSMAGPAFHLVSGWAGLLPDCGLELNIGALLGSVGAQTGMCPAGSLCHLDYLQSMTVRVLEIGHFQNLQSD